MILKIIIPIIIDIIINDQFSMYIHKYRLTFQRSTLPIFRYLNSANYSTVILSALSIRHLMADRFGMAVLCFKLLFTLGHLSRHAGLIGRLDCYYIAVIFPLCNNLKDMR